MARKLATFYFFYFALLGVMVPFLGLYLECLHFSLLEIAQLSALLMLTKILAPNIWGVLADRQQCRLKLVRLGSSLTCVGYIGFFFADSFWSMAVVIVAFSFFWNAVLPQFEVITLHNLGANKARYSRVRLWGSIGFILAVVVLGELFEYFDIALFPWALLVIIVAIFISSLCDFQEPNRSEALDEGRVSTSFLSRLRMPGIGVFFVVCFLLQLSHGAYYTYFSIYLQTAGFTEWTIGLLWGLGVAAEVVLFVVMHQWFAVNRLTTIMIMALSLTSIRWVLIAFGIEHVLILVLAQLLHAFSFGAMHACAIHFVHEAFPHAQQGKAQALYSSVGFGLGGACGALASGLGVTHYGYTFTFCISAFVSVLAVLLTITARNNMNRYTLPS